MIGVLHVGTLTGRVFTSEDVDLLQLAADRAALAVQALYAQLDRATSAALQRSLLSSALPEICGLEMAAPAMYPALGTSVATGMTCSVCPQATSAP